MSLFVRVGPHIIRKSQIVRVVNQSYHPHPKSRPSYTETERVIVLRDGSKLSTKVGIHNIEILLGAECAKDDE